MSKNEINSARFKTTSAGLVMKTESNVRVRDDAAELNKSQDNLLMRAGSI